MEIIAIKRVSIACSSYRSKILFLAGCSLYPSGPLASSPVIGKSVGTWDARRANQRASAKMSSQSVSSIQASCDERRFIFFSRLPRTVSLDRTLFELLGLHSYFIAT